MPSIVLRPGGTSPLTTNGETITVAGVTITETGAALHKPTVTLLSGSTSVLVLDAVPGLFDELFEEMF